MSALPSDPVLPLYAGKDPFIRSLLVRLNTLLRQMAEQVNGVSKGTMENTLNAATAAPTAGTYALGDFVKNSAPAEAGAASSKYIITGWICTTAGTPGTWKESRVLTGN